MLTIPPSLKHRKFFLLWLGILVSYSGSRMQFVALLWHIRTLTDKPIALGLVGLVRVIPIIIFSLVSGVVADTFDRKTILYFTQGLQTLEALALAWLTFTGQVQLWHLYVLTAIEAVASSFDMPARQAMVPNLLPLHVLPNAFSMTSLAFTVASIAGPVLAGGVLAAPGLGQAYTYLFNAISFAAIFLALILMGKVPQRTKTSHKFEWSDVKVGIQFISNAPIILSSMILDFVATFFSSAYALLPIFARDVLHVGEVGYGWLAAADSIGAALAALVISQLPDIRKQGMKLVWAVVLYGLATIAFGLSPTFWMALLSLMVVGASDTLSMVIRNTIRQLRTPDELRGRMTSINQIFFMGGPQLGEMEAGIVAQLFGPVVAVVSGGIGCIIGVFWIMRKWPALVKYEGEENQVT
jgi:MFS family permease